MIPQANIMEIFYFTLITSIFLCNIFLIKKMQETLYEISKIYRLNLICYDKIDSFQENLNSFDEKLIEQEKILNLLSLASKAPTEPPMKSFKPNNWDSMRAAFKGPTRVDINE